MSRSCFYFAYLNSPEWKVKAFCHMRSVDFRCEVCFYERATGVHHASYDRLGEETASDLIAVCRWCHRKLHRLPPVAANDNQLELPFAKTG